ncbi:hypothetical protein DSO57_1020780 [Entomophthora muscae]|uniref:Uncharacterized protein n=1 Tax=Entomophthora muscae TaxID=34485 RepID=A0ACC2TQQ7_9FUNG|nr:hypothetical protein DSO57_1020780 [Entomophthora muscae]
MSCRLPMHIVPIISLLSAMKIFQFCKPPVGVLDPMMLQEMENRANEVASQVNLMLDQIRSHMSEFTELTLQTVNIYQEGTESLKEAFESSIENSANLIMKCDELDKNFGSLYALRDQVQLKAA